MSAIPHTPATIDERKMWSYLKEHDQVTHADLKSATGVSDYRRTNYVSKLRRLGILRDCGRRGSVVVFTTMDQDAANEFAAAKRNTPEGAMWTAMRVMRTFTPDEILLTLQGSTHDLPLKTIKSYCGDLLRADVLVVVQKARPNIRPARYRLASDTGPMPIVVRNLKVIVDTNDDRAIYIQGARQ